MATTSMSYTIPDGNGGNRGASQQEYEAFRENARQNGGIKNWYDNADLKYQTKAWDAYGGAPGAQAKGSEDGSQAWKNSSRARKSPTSDMQNPVQIDGWWYDKPIPKAEKRPPANLSGGQATVPTVQQRMSRMGEAVQKGVNKGSIKSNQLDKYQVPGQAASDSPLVNQLKPRIGTLNPNSGAAGQAQNAILKKGDNSNPYYYKPVMPDFSSINPNDPDEIRYQQNIKAQQEAGKNGQPVQAILYSSKARNDIMDKTAEINRLGQDKMTAARKADPRSKDMVNYAAANR
jgi:hypothetical protein